MKMDKIIFMMSKGWEYMTLWKTSWLKVNDSKIILETLTNQKTYFDQKPLEKLVVDKLTSGVKSEKRTIAVSVYTDYSDKEREQFIDKMIECAQEKGATARVARNMGINVRNVQREWKQYREGSTMSYKKKQWNERSS